MTMTSCSPLKTSIIISRAMGDAVESRVAIHDFHDTIHDRLVNFQVHPPAKTPVPLTFPPSGDQAAGPGDDLGGRG